MGRIPERVIEEIRERADVVQVVGRYVTLRKSGSRYLGLCPFHTEKTPSFHVDPSRGFYHCFGCGEGGDVFSFRMRHDGASFLDTVRSLAREFGVEIPQTGGERESRSAPLYEINESALEYFRASLRSPAGAPARAYLEQRGVPQELVDHFQLGYAPPGWDGLLGWLRRRRESIERAAEAGLVVTRETGDGHYDRFRGRVIFPIHEPGGRVVGFGGRGLADDTPKYLNSSESPIYRKGRALFGLSLAVDAIRQRGCAVVVEGYFDLIALHRAAIREGVAPCGTALSSEHARRIRRYTREVVLLFDGDDAGRRAAERALPVLSAEGLRVRAAFLPPGEDPDTLLALKGEAALRGCVDAAVPLLDFLIDQKLARARTHAWDAADAAHELAPLLAAVADPIERAAYVRTVASRLELPPASIGEAVRAGGREAHRARPAASPAARRPPEIDPVLRVLLGALGSHPELVPLLDDLGKDGLAPGDDAWLVRRVVDALRARGREGVAHLLSPAAEELPAEFKNALSAVLVEVNPGTPSAAERAVRDCVARLRIRALNRALDGLEERRRSCRDPARERRLFEEQQQIRRERGALETQIRHD